MSATVDLPITGGCNCGAVRYEISEPLLGAGYCHCTRCQRRTGSAAACSAQVRPGSFTLISGDDELRRWNAGDGFDKVFCSVCGSAVFAQNPQDHDVLAVRMGTFDGDPGVRPLFRQYVGSAAVWEALPDDDLPRFEARRTS